MKTNSLYFARMLKAIKLTGNIFGFVFKLSMTALWTVCMLSGGELGLAAIGAGIIFFGFSAIIG